jgi:hypothetical protein
MTLHLVIHDAIASNPLPALLSPKTIEEASNQAISTTLTLTSCPRRRVLCNVFTAR